MFRIFELCRKSGLASTIFQSTEKQTKTESSERKDYWELRKDFLTMILHDLKLKRHGSISDRISKTSVMNFVSVILLSFWFVLVGKVVWNGRRRWLCWTCTIFVELTFVLELLRGSLPLVSGFLNIESQWKSDCTPNRRTYKHPRRIFVPKMIDSVICRV